MLPRYAVIPRYVFTDKTQDCIRRFLIHDRKLGDDKDVIAVCYEPDAAELIVRLLNENAVR